MPLLSVNAGCLAYGDVPLLDHVDFQIDAGERVALIGRNGTGKSSLLAAIAGLRALDDGHAWAQHALERTATMAQHVLQHGQAVGQRLARARLGAAQQVQALQNDRDGRLLNGRGSFKTLV